MDAKHPFTERHGMTLPAVARADIWIALLLSVTAGLVFYPFASLRLDPHHDGIMLKPALDVLSGQVLFRDTFTQYGPLTTYLQALALAIHPALLSLRMLALIANAGSLFFLYLSWRVLLPRPLSLVASLLFVLSAQFYDPEFPLIPWSSILALFFQSVAILSLLRIVTGSAHAAWPWVLGAACASALWCRQPVGIILTLSVGTIAVALHLAGWRSGTISAGKLWVRTGVAFCACSLLVLGHLAFHGALTAWWEQTILWPGRWALGYNESIFWVYARRFLWPPVTWILFVTLLVAFLPALLRRIRPGIPGWVDVSWLVLLSGIYLGFARPVVAPSLLLYLGGWNVVFLITIVALSIGVVVRACRERLSARPSLDREFYASATLAGLALGSALQIYPLPEPNHIYWALAPGLGVFVYACHRLLRFSAVGGSLALLLIFAPATYNKYRWANHTRNQPTVTLVTPRVLAGMRVDAPLAAAIERSYAIIRPLLEKNPGQRVILYGDDALYLGWFENRENPSPYYVIWRDLIPPAEVQKRLEYVFMAKPVILFHGRGMLELPYVPVDYEITPVEPLLGLRMALPGQVRTDGTK